MTRKESHLFGIVQGGREEKLRKESAKIISDMEVDGQKFDGFGIGGSFAKEDMSTAVRWVNEILPENKPRHLLGIGEPADLFMGIENGIDLFDCVLPTRNARHGQVYRFVHDDFSRPDFYEVLHLTNESLKLDERPLVEAVEGDDISQELSRYSLAYIRHLFTVEEMLGQRLATLANVRFYLELMTRIRRAIDSGKL
jgi:queuine tRNA-ribosyltransferase